MRLLAGLVVLIVVFAILVRIVPADWGLVLYVTFVILTIAFTGWERRRIAERRRRLRRELEQERMKFGRRQKEPPGDDQQE